MIWSLSRPVKPLFQGFFWMSGAVLSFIAMGIGGRELSDNLSTFQILTFRGLIALIITIMFIMSIIIIIGMIGSTLLWADLNNIYVP